MLRRIGHPEVEYFERLSKEPLPAEDEASWVELICKSSKSRVFFVCAGVAFWSQACGTEVVIYYSPELMELRKPANLPDPSCFSIPHHIAQHWLPIFCAVLSAACLLAAAAMPM